MAKKFFFHLQPRTKVIHPGGGGGGVGGYIRGDYTRDFTESAPRGKIAYVADYRTIFYLRAAKF